MANVAPTARPDRSAIVPGRLPAVPAPRRLLGKLSLTWLPVAPFFLYVTIFMLLPSLSIVQGAFSKSTGSGYTLDHVRTLFDPQYRDAFWTSIKLSVATALTGGIFGLFVAYAAVKEGAPRWIRSALITFSGVAANFAGVPLAFAFIATIGTTGVITSFLSSYGIDIYSNGFTLYSFTGLTIVYTYFQLPLMILIISPSIDGLRSQWREAAENLGANTFQYWRMVGLPILWPSLLSAMVLLFGSAFSAYATAYALIGSGSVNLVPIIIGAVMSGNITIDPNLGDALALGMIVIIGFTVAIYALLQRRASRWLR
ncbi:MAG TPA: ABC transporter permease subunit [Chloroflexota bacterium]|nr:ABC transporter permease subunit [Chloroflexota bacterium]